MGNNPILYSDPMGDTLRVHVFDQASRPQDNGTAGTTYTADIYVYDDETGELHGPYDGSSYPNSTSNSDNTTTANTLDEGTNQYDNASGHKGGTKKGLNIVDSSGNRDASGEKPDGTSVTMKYVNVHTGVSDKGNATSRGSRGCITICPTDVSTFFNHFDFSGTGGKTGNAAGTITVSRGRKATDATALKATAKFKRREVQLLKDIFGQ
jgi:hypothetical protein